ncbi:MAG: HD domain-containing protein [Anaerolineae bacterium]
MPNTIRGLPDFVQARAYALGRLERELPSTLYYHSIWHTRDEVVTRADWLARQEDLNAEARLLVKTGAYYHDIGFVEGRQNHEVRSASIAGSVLPQFGYAVPQVRMIQGMILATRIPQLPHTHLEEIVADADLDVLGRDDFLARSRALRAELAAAGEYIDHKTWYTRQARFLRQHRYFTPSARRDRCSAKDENLLALYELIAGCGLSPDVPPLTPMAPTFALT